MPENKRSAPAAAMPAKARRGDAMQDLDDVTVLFTTPPELIKQTAARDERDEDVTAFRSQPSSWENSDDEATLAIQLSSALPSLKPLQPAPSARPLATPLVAPAASVEIGDAELGAILGPRRAARWVALGAAVTFVLVLLIVARLAP
jgi:hypothetical protein